MQGTMKKRGLLVKSTVTIFLGLLLFGSPQVHATPIAIENYSFENPSLADNVSSASVPGWSIFDSSPGIATVIWNPPSIPLNQFEIDGSNVLAAHGGEYTYQVLNATLSANTLYTLSVDIGNVRSSIGGLEYYWAGYAVQFWAGDTMLADDNYSLHPNPSHFLTSTVSYYAAADDLLLGEQLQIRLMSLGDQSKFMAFDNVQLDATLLPIPEPATMLLLSSGLIGLAGARRKFKK